MERNLEVWFPVLHWVLLKQCTKVHLLAPQVVLSALWVTKIFLFWTWQRRIRDYKTCYNGVTSLLARRKDATVYRVCVWHLWSWTVLLTWHWRLLQVQEAVECTVSLGWGNCNSTAVYHTFVKTMYNGFFHMYLHKHMKNTGIIQTARSQLCQDWGGHPDRWGAASTLTLGPGPPHHYNALSCHISMCLSFTV